MPSNADLGIEDEQFVAVRAFADGERVDLDLFGVGREEGVIEAGEDLGGLLGEVARQAERGRNGCGRGAAAGPWRGR